MSAFHPKPYDLRTRYDLRPGDRYYYNDGYLYRVDPRTMLVEQVITALFFAVRRMLSPRVSHPKQTLTRKPELPSER